MEPILKTLSLAAPCASRFADSEVGRMGRVPLPFHSTSDFRYQTSNNPRIFVYSVYSVVKLTHFYMIYTYKISNY